MAEMTIGRTKISIKASGCDRCGTEWSSGWYQAETVTVRIKNREFDLDIHRCADCVDKPTYLKKLGGAA